MVVRFLDKPKKIKQNPYLIPQLYLTYSVPDVLYIIIE